MSKDNHKPLNNFQVIIEIIKYNPFLYIFNGFLWLLIHLFPLIPGLLIREFFNVITGNSSVNVGVWGIIAVFISFSITRIILIIFGFKADILYRFNISSLLKRNLLNKMIKTIDFNSLKMTSGEIISNYRDDVQQIEDTIDWFLDIIGTLAFAITAIVILLSINQTITIFVFLPLALVLVIGHLFSKKIHRYRVASREATSKVTGAIGETFNSILAIKVANSEEYVLKHIKTLNKTRQQMNLRDTLFNQILDSIYFNTVNIGTGLILLLSVQTLKVGTFSVGDFALFISYLSFVSDFVLFFGYFIAKFQQIKVSIKRLQSLLLGDHENDLVKHNPIYLNQQSPKPIYNSLREEDKFKLLEIKNLSYTYPDSINGIRNIHFTIKKGSFTVITGRIGSGKTTLLKSILGLLNKHDGEILYNGRKIENLDEFFIFPHASYTPQIPRLFSDTIENNILLGLDINQVDINKAIYHAVLEPDLKQLEKGLDTIIGPKGVKLSGGQIQRVAAARMFIRDSEIFIFDDISSALDVNTEKELWNRLFEINKTCIVVSNKRIALQHATNIIVLKDGKIEAQGKLDELLETCEEMKKIWS